MALIRLQKIISEAGVSSRRGAERLIADGRVKVNGQVIDTQGVQADPDKDTIEIDGRVIGPAEQYVYYMFNKPAGFLTALADPRGRPTVKEFLDRLPARVFPVGRLDMDVEGLLILTNDGELARRLMHPSFEIPKIYRVKVQGLPDETALNKLRDGVLLVGDRPAAPAKARRIKTGPDRAWIELTLTEGRHRQVKRMCSGAGHPVLKLKREAYANLTLGRLPLGEIKKLSPAEIAGLKKAVKY